MCTVQLPPDVNPIAVNKYIISSVMVDGHRTKPSTAVLFQNNCHGTYIGVRRNTILSLSTAWHFQLSGASIISLAMYTSCQLNNFGTRPLQAGVNFVTSFSWPLVRVWEVPYAWLNEQSFIVPLAALRHAVPHSKHKERPLFRLVYRMKLLKFNQAGKWNASLPHKVTCLIQERIQSLANNLLM
jgi:hypothetical protein